MAGVDQIRVSEFAPGRFAPFASPLAVPVGLALLRPVYWIFAGIVAGAALYFGGIQAMAIAVAVLIALWAFAEPRAALWLTTAFMVFLFVFFQNTAPLGEDLPAEFLYWGIGLALITAGLAFAALFSSQVDWALSKRRLVAPESVAMAAMLMVILAASVYGLAAGNPPAIVERQLFGCVMFPVYYFVSLALFRSSADVERWLRSVGWVISLGSLWYVQRLSSISLARGVYYREQSPLVIYSGAAAVVAWIGLLERRRPGLWLQALTQGVLCLLAILLMGNRSALGSCLAAIVVVTAIMLWRRRGLALALMVILVPVGVGVAPYLMNRALESRNLPGMIAGRFIFALAEDQSYQGRVAQSQVVMNMVNERPILGAGMGSENSFIMPGQHRLKVASVDNGWGYLLLKMGYVGLAAFLAFFALLFRRGLAGLQRARGGALRTVRYSVFAVGFYAMVTFVAGPTFFHFSTAPFFATFLGALVVASEAREQAKAITVRRRAA
ncbi:MAG TPA: O-antigen ligase family protein [Candidatus Acidoferrales bacterium]|nr:O-antigen ligase family protein [Candidatus Acidoferrales bacterium]